MNNQNYLDTSPNNKSSKCDDDKCLMCPTKGLSSCPNFQYRIWLLHTIWLVHQNALKDIIKFEDLERIVSKAIDKDWRPRFVLVGLVAIQEERKV